MSRKSCSTCDNFICFCCDYGLCRLELFEHYPDMNFDELVRVIDGDCEEVPHRDAQVEFRCLGYEPLTAHTAKV